MHAHRRGIKSRRDECISPATLVEPMQLPKPESDANRRGDDGDRNEKAKLRAAQ